jgi:hypothetical protein
MQMITESIAISFENSSSETLNACVTKICVALIRFLFKSGRQWNALWRLAAGWRAHVDVRPCQLPVPNVFFLFSSLDVGGGKKQTPRICQSVLNLWGRLQREHESLFLLVARRFISRRLPPAGPKNCFLREKSPFIRMLSPSASCSRFRSPRPSSKVNKYSAGVLNDRL